MSKAHTQAAAQPAVAADRFAREIVGFLKAFPARSRQLNGKPLGGWGVWSAGVSWLVVRRNPDCAFCRRSSCRCPWCWGGTSAGCADCPLCPPVHTARGAAVWLLATVRCAGVVLCGVWFRQLARRAAWSCADVVLACGVCVSDGDQPPNPPVQRTRFAPRDRAQFRPWFRAKRRTNLDGAPLTGKPLGRPCVAVSWIV